MSKREYWGVLKRVKNAFFNQKREEDESREGISNRSCLRFRVFVGYNLTRYLRFQSEPKNQTMSITLKKDCIKDISLRLRTEYCHPGDDTIVQDYVLALMKTCKFLNREETEEQFNLYLTSTRNVVSYDQIISPHHSHIWESLFNSGMYEVTNESEFIGSSFENFKMKKEEIHLSQMIVPNIYDDKFIRLQIIKSKKDEMFQNFYSLFLCEDPIGDLIITVIFGLSEFQKFIFSTYPTKIVVYSPIYWLNVDCVHFVRVDYFQFCEVDCPILKTPTLAFRSTELENLNKLAKYCFTQKKYEEALPFYRFLNSSQLKEQKYQQNIVVCLNKLRFFEEASEEIDTYLRRFRKLTFKILYQRIVSLIGLKKYETAASEISKLKNHKEYRSTYGNRLTKTLLDSLRSWSAGKYDFYQVFRESNVSSIPQNYYGGKSPSFELGSSGGLLATKILEEGEIICVEKAYVCHLKNVEGNEMPIMNYGRYYSYFLQKTFELSNSASTISKYLLGREKRGVDPIQFSRDFFSSSFYLYMTIWGSINIRMHVGYGIFENLSKITRSCISNCANESFGDVMMLVAKQRIEKGEELTVSAVSDHTIKFGYFSPHLFTNFHTRCSRFRCFFQKTNMNKRTSCGVCSEKENDRMKLRKICETLLPNDSFRENIQKELENPKKQKDRAFLECGGMSSWPHYYRMLLPAQKEEMFFKLKKYFDEKEEEKSVFLFILLSILVTNSKSLKGEEKKRFHVGGEFQRNVFFEIEKLCERFRLNPLNYVGVVTRTRENIEKTMYPIQKEMFRDRTLRILWKFWRRFYGFKNISVFSKLFTGEENVENSPILKEFARKKAKKEFRCGICQLEGNVKCKKCGKCKKVRYCDSQCQFVDWRMGHREICRKR